MSALAVCATLAAGICTISLADSPKRSGEQRINDRMVKDADDHLKSNLSDDAKRDVLKKELVRAAAMDEMAETLSKDANFRQSYTTLITNNAKRAKDVMPDEKDIMKEKESVINDPEAMKRVMAAAMLKIKG